MIKLCTDPTCDETAAMSVQRSGDVAPVVYCLPHGYQRENELKQLLENFVSVVLERPASDLDRALARVQELEKKPEPEGAGAGAGVGSSADDLALTLHTLETQSQALATARHELADREQALQLMRRELERTRRELETARGDLHAAVRTIERLRAARVPGDGPPAPVPATVITPAPPTRPDPE